MKKEVKAVFFDLDGTLLPIDEKDFVKAYFSLLYEAIKDHGYEKEKLIDTIWAGTKAMMENDGSQTNEEAFWKVFVRSYGEERLVDRPLFDRFYVTEFARLKEVTKPNPLAKSIIEYARNRFGLAVLATNPIFPFAATQTRMSFVGLSPTDFDAVTSYENSRFCKPNPAYFQDLLQRFSLRPENVLVIGNNDYEDGDCARLCGIDCLLVKGYLIHDPHAKGKYPELSMEEVLPFLQNL